MSNRTSRLRTGAVRFFAIAAIGIIFFTITSAGASAASPSFIDSVKEFFGMAVTESALVAAPIVANAGATATPTPGATATPTPVACNPQVIFAYTFQNNRLISFNAGTPETLLTNIFVTGLNTGEFLSGLDFRPATGQLFAIGSTGVAGTTNGDRVLVINPATGAATAVGGGFTTPAGIFFGLDFNPAVDRIRVVSDADASLRLDPTDGRLANTDTNLAYASGDVNFGANPNVVHVAYTNNTAGTASTTLFGIDSTTNALVRIGGANGTPSPNGGLLTTVGPLGFDITDFGAFDIQANSGIAYAALRVANVSGLYTINLATGAATLVSSIGGAGQVDGLAVSVCPAGATPTPTPSGSPTATPTPSGSPSPSPSPTPIGGPRIYAYDFTNNRLVSFNADAPNVLLSNVAITGLTMPGGLQRGVERSQSPNVSGEFLEGIDFRPSNGLLYAVATNGINERVVTINISTGAVTTVNAGSLTAPADIFYGVDFNPVPDRIRVVGDAESNRRFNPNDGTILTDSPLAYAAGDPNFGANPNVVHVAYNNNIVGTVNTTLFGIDTNLNILVRIGGVGGTPSPNAGTVTTIGPLGVDPASFGGFDIQQGTNTAYASLYINDASILHTINLLTGRATPIGTIGNGTLEIDGLSVVVPPPSTAAGVTVSGRVTTPDGRGLRNARVSIVDSEGVVRTVATSSFGFYSFEDVEVGENYIISVDSRRYRFESRVLAVVDSISDVNFFGLE